MEIIDCKNIAEKIKDDIAKNVFSNLDKKRPNLAIVLVGKRSDSALYVKIKEREAKKVGVDTHLYQCPENITEKELKEIIEYLNNDDLIDAILIQLPLPNHLSASKVVGFIDGKKDADGFHEYSLIDIRKNNWQDDLPPLIESILQAIIYASSDDLKDRKICIIANSDFFGKITKEFFEARDGIVELVEKDGEKIKEADIIVTAIGDAKFLKKNQIKNEAIVVDVGISYDELGQVCGDVDLNDLKDKKCSVTPVPGGIGPLTVANLLKRVVRLSYGKYF